MTKTIAVILLILFISYTLILRYRKKEPWDWFTSLISTIISVLLGIIVAIYIFNYQNTSANNHQREDLKFLLKIEFNKNLQFIEEEMTDIKKTPIKLSNGQDFHYYSIKLSDKAIYKAIYSSLFDYTQTKNLFQLAINIDAYNSMIDEFYKVFIISNENNRNAFLKLMYVTQKERYSNMSNNINYCAKLLKIDLNETQSNK